MLNILDIIEPSVFLNKLYPNGIDKLAIHKIDFMTSNYGHSSVYIYTNQRPEIMDIPRHGVFGEDYDTLVIDLSCEIYDLEIYNSANNKSYLPVEISCNNGSGYKIKQVWDGGSIMFNIDGKFIFQRISTYFSE